MHSDYVNMLIHCVNFFAYSNVVFTVFNFHTCIETIMEPRQMNITNKNCDTAVVYPSVV